MSFHPIFPALPVIACVLALTGCAAVPLAQIAATQMAAPQPQCATAPACPATPSASGLADMSKGFGASIQKLTSLVSDSQLVPAPAK